MVETLNPALEAVILLPLEKRTKKKTLSFCTWTKVTIFETGKKILQLTTPTLYRTSGNRAQTPFPKNNSDYLRILVCTMIAGFQSPFSPLEASFLTTPHSHGIRMLLRSQCSYLFLPAESSCKCLQELERRHIIISRITATGGNLRPLPPA